MKTSMTKINLICILAICAFSPFCLAETLLDQFAVPDKWINVSEVEAKGKSLIVKKNGEGIILNSKNGKCRNIWTKKILRWIQK